MAADTSMDALADLSDQEDAEELDLSLLQIDWLDLHSVDFDEKLGICSLPGCRYKKIWRSVTSDIECIVKAGVKDVFCLCTKGELHLYRSEHLLEKYTEAGLTPHHYPIEDGQVPTMKDLMILIEDIRVCLMAGRKTIIHCYGGLGRSCAVAACLLMVLDDDITAEKSSEKVKDLRGHAAIQSVKQYNFVSDFRDTLKAYRQDLNGMSSRSASR